MQWTSTQAWGVYLILGILFFVWLAVFLIEKYWIKGLNDHDYKQIKRSPELAARDLAILERALIMRDVSKIESNTRK